MAGYIGSKAVSLNVTSGDILGDVGVGGDVSVGDDLTVGDDATIAGDLDVAGDVAITAGGTLDVFNSGNAATTLTALFGADNGAGNGRTNSTVKSTVLGVPHYTNSEEAVGLIVAGSTSSSNFIAIGGGGSVVNAATEINFCTAANQTTTGGTTRMSVNSAGHVSMPNQAWASVSSSTATSANSYVPLNDNAVVNGGVTVGSTNKITVPIAGNYLVGFHMLSDDQTSTYVIVRKNGNNIPGMNGQNQTDTYDNFSVQNIVTLAADDYIQFFVAGGKVHGNQGYNRMYVYKLG